MRDWHTQQLLQTGALLCALHLTDELVGIQLLALKEKEALDVGVPLAVGLAGDGRVYKPDSTAQPLILRESLGDAVIHGSEAVPKCCAWRWDTAGEGLEGREEARGEGREAREGKKGMMGSSRSTCVHISTRARAAAGRLLGARIECGRVTQRTLRVVSI